MTTVRLHVDGQGEGWAMVQCDRCKDVHRYRAAEASQGKVTCKCGHTMDVSDKSSRKSRSGRRPTIFIAR
jgi:hypothetical protein